MCAQHSKCQSEKGGGATVEHRGILGGKREELRSLLHFSWAEQVFPEDLGRMGDRQSLLQQFLGNELGQDREEGKAGWKPL